MSKIELGKQIPAFPEALLDPGAFSRDPFCYYYTMSAGETQEKDGVLQKNAACASPGIAK